MAKKQEFKEFVEGQSSYHNNINRRNPLLWLRRKVFKQAPRSRVANRSRPALEDIACECYAVGMAAV